MLRLDRPRNAVDGVGSGICLFLSLSFYCITKELQKKCPQVLMHTIIHAARKANDTQNSSGNFQNTVGGGVPNNGAVMQTSAVNYLIAYCCLHCTQDRPRLAYNRPLSQNIRALSCANKPPIPIHPYVDPFTRKTHCTLVSI